MDNVYSAHFTQKKSISVSLTDYQAEDEALLARFFNSTVHFHWDLIVYERCRICSGQASADDGASTAYCKASTSNY